jgi:hypothetical protein
MESHKHFMFLFWNLWVFIWAMIVLGIWAEYEKVIVRFYYTDREDIRLATIFFFSMFYVLCMFTFFASLYK